MHLSKNKINVLSRQTLSGIFLARKQATSHYINYIIFAPIFNVLRRLFRLFSLLVKIGLELRQHLVMHNIAYNIKPNQKYRYQSHTT